MGGNSVKIKNETPYPISYIYWYEHPLRPVQVHGTLRAGEMVEVNRVAFPRIIFLKQGHRTSDECLYHYDLYWWNNGKDSQTITIREKGSDQSELELICDSRPEILTCPNYGKQEKDRLEMEKRRREEEERRQAEQRERERKIQEQIETENKRLKENLSKILESLTRMRKESHPQVEYNEVVEKKFYQILKDNFLQDKERSTRTIAEIIQNMRLQIMLKYIEEKQLSVDCLKNWDDLVGFKNLSLRDELSVLEAMIGVALNPNNSQILVKNKNKDDRVNYSVSILSKLFTINKELASNGLTHIEKSTGKGLLSGIDCCE
ncbi:hypothetical protein XELAEV_18028469mg [Xenopus laevis]|uniref:Uncharacterized protein n=1 Tax=Xenopus laevis TaxID=8355 RepID=A0A974CZR2_XENLA|nr:hypothetical protein XELAEV_18028469mg [Xenopus laevis]